MHMADALVAPVVAGTMYLCSSAVAGYSIKKVRLEDNPKKIPVMGVMGAFIFATQMINFAIPGTGSSGHLAGGMLLSALLGPYAGFLTMIGVLVIQCLMFADGGILALGCNIWNMAFYSCFIGAIIIWKSIMKRGISKRKITVASILSCVITLQLGAFSVVLETVASGITQLPLVTFLSVMQPIHLAIGFVEGLITAAVLCFIYEARPELLWGIGGKEIFSKGKLSFKNTLIIFSVATTIIAAIVSLVASRLPDGLEWSISRITGNTELNTANRINDMVSNFQKSIALLPDYSIKGSNAVLENSFSGILGGLIVIVLCVICCYLFRFFKREK